MTTVTTSVSEEYAESIRQHGKTNVTFKEIIKAINNEQRAVAMCFDLIRTHAIVLPDEPPYILKFWR